MFALTGDDKYLIEAGLIDSPMNSGGKEKT